MHPELTERLVIRLGEFHQLMSFLGVIGKRFRDAGLLNLIIESGIVAQRSANSVINGHHYNRSLRCHRLAYEALGRLCFQAFMDSLAEETRVRFERCIERLQETFPSPLFEQLLSSEEVSEMFTRYSDFR